MEPDVAQVLHHGQHYQPTSVLPVQGEPAYEHEVAKGEKLRKEDAHYDVLEEQHRSHVEHELHPVVHHRDYYGGYVAPHAMAYDPYWMGDYPYARDPYSLRDYEMYADPYAAAAFGYHTERRHQSELTPKEVSDKHFTHAPLYTPEEELQAAHGVVHHAAVHAPVHAEAVHGVGPHDAMPIHAASTEAHVSSTPEYY